MISLEFRQQPALFIEIGQKSWLASHGDDLAEFPLERLENGRMTDACRQRLVAGLRSFVNKKGWRSGRRALVAIGARGVSVRRMTLPPAPREELPRLLRLQIESEFPVSPDELAWGWQWLGQKAGRQDVLVAAIKKEMLEPGLEILTACGIAPSFTLAALARNALRPPPQPTCAVLHIGPVESELLSFQDGAPAGIRVLPWGADSGAPPAPGLINPASMGGQLYLTGWGARGPSAGSFLSQCPALEWGPIDDRSAAIAGLKKSVAPGSDAPLLIIQTGDDKNGARAAAGWKWAAAAAVLLIALLGFSYAEAVVLQPHLAKKLAIIQADRERLPAIDRELDFLQYIKRSQPPYLDALYLIAKVAPPGTTFESLSMSRRGDFSIRGKLPNADEVTHFRSNLIQSAWFSAVVVEEQSPSPDRKVAVRMTAQLKPVDSRRPIPDEPPAKSEHAINSVKSPRPTNK